MMSNRRWLSVHLSVLGVLGLLLAGAQSAQAATLGTSTIGAVNGGGLVANAKRVNKYQLSVPASVSKMGIYLSPSGTPGSQAMEGVIYADHGGSPGALLAQSKQISFSSSDPAGWYDLPFSSDVALSPGKYWLGIYTGAMNAVAAYRYDVGASGRARRGNDQTYVQDGASNPFGAHGWSDTHVMSLFATYTTPAWTLALVPAPSAFGGRLTGVSCSSGSACTAVGSSQNGSGTQVPLAERWNGTSWSIQPTPNPTGSIVSSLSGVSCTSSTTCTAVGSDNTAPSEPLAERYS